MTAYSQPTGRSRWSWRNTSEIKLRISDKGMMSKHHFSAVKPSEPGWYWSKSPDGQISINKIFDNPEIIPGVLWAGPIKEPTE